MEGSPPPVVGVLALQGDFVNHRTALEACGTRVCMVRHPRDLVHIEAVVLPGGESTSLEIHLDRTGLRGPLTKEISAGLPTLATCAGLILLSRDIEAGKAGQRTMDLLNIAVERNGFGGQVHSFEAPLSLPKADCHFPGVFIRAPRILDARDTEVVAELGDGTPVGVRQGNVTALCFHPELTHDRYFHRQLVKLAAHRSRVNAELQ